MKKSTIDVGPIGGEVLRQKEQLDALTAQVQRLVDRVQQLEARVPLRSVLARDVPGHHDY